MESRKAKCKWKVMRKNALEDGALVVGIGGAVFLHVPHLSLCDALVHTYGCKGAFPGPVRIYLALPLKPNYYVPVRELDT